MRTPGMLLAATVLVLAGCSSSPPTTEESSAPEVTPLGQSAAPTADASTSSAPPEDVEKFFEAIAMNDSDEDAKAVKLAAPRSIAAAYATHRSAVDGALLDSGNPYDADTFDTIDTGYTSCSDAADDSTCTKFENIQTKGGRVSNFTVNGKSLDKRLSLGDGQKVRAGGLATVEFVSAYKTASSESLYVTFNIRSKKRAVDLNQLYQATYRDPSGRSAKATDAFVFDDLDPKSTARTAVVFKKAKPGGVVTVEIVDEKTYVGAKAKVKVG